MEGNYMLINRAVGLLLMTALVGCAEPIDVSQTPNATAASSQATSLHLKPANSEARPSSAIELLSEAELKALVRDSSLATAQHPGPNGFPWRYLCVPEALQTAYENDRVDVMLILQQIVDEGTHHEAYVAGGFACGLDNPYGSWPAAHAPVSEETQELYRERMPLWVEDAAQVELHRRCGTILDAPPSYPLLTEE